jgi:biotin carboxyl carrier protein
MQYEVEVGGRCVQVVVTRVGDGFAVSVDGRVRQVDAARIDAHTLSFLVSNGLVGEGHGGDGHGGDGHVGDGHVGDGHVGDGLKAVPVPYDDNRGDNRSDNRVSSNEVSLAANAATGELEIHVGETPVTVTLNGRRRWGRKDDGGAAGSGPQRLIAPMPGKIVRVLVKAGDAVTVRQPVVVVEAMKMENELRASRDGTVAELQVSEGMSVEAGALLLVIQ